MGLGQEQLGMRLWSRSGLGGMLVGGRGFRLGFRKVSVGMETRLQQSMEKDPAPELSSAPQPSSPGRRTASSSCGAGLWSSAFSLP